MRQLLGNPLAAATLVVAAALIGVSFHGPGLTPLSWVGLTAIALLIDLQYFKLLPAYIAGIVMQLAGVDWMRHCYSTLAVTEARLTNWLLVGAALGIVLPAVLGIAMLLRRRHWPLWLILPVAWTVGDFLRYELGYVFAGGPYPWLTFALAQTDFLIPCQVADLGGMWGVGFLAAMFCGMLAQSVVQRRVLAMPMLLICAAIVYGQWRIASDEAAAGPRVALMPGQAIRVPDADFALWPEVAFENYTPLRTSTVLIQGCYRESQGNVFNSVAVLSSGELLGWYDKCNLVPWSEFFPWGGTGRQFARGDKPGVFDCRQVRFGTAICYDVCFTDFMRRLANEHPQFVFIAANESSDPSMMLAHQLLAATRLRAIEIRCAIVRNANGGFSGIVDGNGRLVASATDLREPVTVGPVPLDSRDSLYRRAGGWLPIACILAVVLAVCRRARLQGVPQIAGNVVERKSNGAVAH